MIDIEGLLSVLQATVRPRCWATGGWCVWRIGQLGDVAAMQSRIGKTDRQAFGVRA